MKFRFAILGSMMAAFASLSTGAMAQGPCPQCGSQVPIKDLDKNVSETLSALGLVRAIAQQIGQMNNYEYVGAGTMVDLEADKLGAAVPVSRYVYNGHQQMWASRIEFQGTNTPRTIRVVKGNRAWDESWIEEKAKSGTIKKLKTAPADKAAELRASMIWLEPHMFMTHVGFANGKKCMTAEVKACDTKHSITQENGRAVFTIEINGKTYKGVQDANKRIASVETKVTLPSGGGAKTLVAKYTGWRTGEGDTNDLKNLAAWGDKALDKFHNGTFWPESVVYELDGQKVLELRVNEGWNNPYTIYPEPELLAQGQ